MLFGQEELSALKRERVNRSLLFSPATDLDTKKKDEVDTTGGVISQAQNESEGVLRVSCKQVKRASLYFMFPAKNRINPFRK